MLKHYDQRQLVIGRVYLTYSSWRKESVLAEKHCSKPQAGTEASPRIVMASEEESPELPTSNASTKQKEWTRNGVRLLTSKPIPNNILRPERLHYLNSANQLETKFQIQESMGNILTKTTTVSLVCVLFVASSYSLPEVFLKFLRFLVRFQNTSSLELLLTTSDPIASLC